MITKERIPIIVVGLLTFLILLLFAHIYETRAEEDKVAKIYTYMELTIYQPGFEICLMDEKGTLYSTYDYPQVLLHPAPAVGDLAIVELQFEYVGNQLFNLKHVKVLQFIHVEERGETNKKNMSS